MMESVGLMHSHTLIPGLPQTLWLQKCSAPPHLPMLQRPPLIRQYIFTTPSPGSTSTFFPSCPTNEIKSKYNPTLEIVVRNMK